MAERSPHSYDLADVRDQHALGREGPGIKLDTQEPSIDIQYQVKHFSYCFFFVCELCAGWLEVLVTDCYSMSRLVMVTCAFAGCCSIVMQGRGCACDVLIYGSSTNKQVDDHRIPFHFQNFFILNILVWACTADTTFLRLFLMARKSV